MGNAMSDEDKELTDIANDLKAVYIGALRANGDNWTDSPATAFSDSIMVRVKALLHNRDKSRDQQIALEAQISLLEKMNCHYNLNDGHLLLYEDNGKNVYLGDLLATLKQSNKKG